MWTGPEGARATARDTAVILRELFEGARRRVILAGYSFMNAAEVLGPLHTSMRERGVEACFFIDVAQLDRPVLAPEAAIQAQLQSFIDTHWRFGPPFPALYCDRRALRPGPPWSSLHAKCVAVDGQRAFLSSANFTSRGQDRNIEAGALLHDATFAAQLERQWHSLIDAGLVLRWEPPLSVYSAARPANCPHARSERGGSAQRALRSDVSDCELLVPAADRARRSPRAPRRL